MTEPTIDAVEVPRWAPDIRISDQVTPGPLIDAFRNRASARFTAPAIRFSDPQPLYISGAFAIVAERSGLIPGSTYLAGEYAWPDLFDPPRAVARLPDRPMLVAGNVASHNHWHWLFQCLAPILIAPELGMDAHGVLLPALTPTMREHLAFAGMTVSRIVELPAEAAAVTSCGIYSNLTSGTFAFTPHPRLAGAYEQLACRPPQSDLAGRRLFLSRAGNPHRMMENEAALVEALEQSGFTTIQPQRFSMAEQAALFRDAAIIVAQHGAALTNLLFALPDQQGPAVIELFQDNYLNPCFLKLCQVKRLRYSTSS